MVVLLRWHGVWKSQKKSHSTLRAKRATLTFLSGQKLLKNAQKWSILASFWKPEACGQIVLPDRSVLKGQKSVENAKIQKFKYDILSYFQTMWDGYNTIWSYKSRTYNVDVVDEDACRTGKPENEYVIGRLLYCQIHFCLLSVFLCSSAQYENQITADTIQCSNYRWWNCTQTWPTFSSTKFTSSSSRDLHNYLVLFLLFQTCKVPKKSAFPNLGDALNRSNYSKSSNANSDFAGVAKK